MFQAIPLMILQKIQAARLLAPTIRFPMRYNAPIRFSLLYGCHCSAVIRDEMKVMSQAMTVLISHGSMLLLLL